ncbi:hypothetical protein A2U01_0096180 [Trifolium medium]|uniref:Uncharacterized protein n=1 Tax=Trifolium medium TaxID=97028 RepID=A0A392UQL3_9FABA|nr:hypothetical protein [Trifolium medium]
MVGSSSDVALKLTSGGFGGNIGGENRAGTPSCSFGKDGGSGGGQN